MSISLVMIRLVLEEETNLASVAKTRSKVEGGVPSPVLRRHAHAVQDEELSGHHTPRQDALVD